MPQTKIVVIGAGSASFGLNTLSSLIRSQCLRGSQVALVDQNTRALEIVERLASRLNRDWSAGMRITTHSNHKDALQDAHFIVSAIEVPPREKLWRMDFEIPLKYGLRQPYAENGGPGGFAHAARNISPVLDIAHDIEQACPDAWFINFSNPMIRVCQAVARHSRVRVVGLCHQIKAGYGVVGYTLAKELGIEIPEGLFLSTHADPRYWIPLHGIVRQALQKVDIKAAGLNHFTWMLDLRDRTTGADLYPLFRQCLAALDPAIEPLTRRVMDTFGLFPIPGDEHLCEYLPWLSDPHTQPWQKFDLSLYDWEAAEARRDAGHDQIIRMGQGEEEIDSLLEADSEGALEVIEGIAGAGNAYHLAVNLPNDGYITNLPQGAVVEVPGHFSGMGVRGVGMGALPEGVAELCRRETMVSQLTVDAVVYGDRRLALQALLLSPGITDLDVAQNILDDYLLAYREHLPTFWK
jgi:alpha-galactosidase